MALNARDDVAALRVRFPGWLIVTVWQSAGTGPDRRALVASRAGVRLADLTAAGLAGKITREQRRDAASGPADGGA